MKRYQEAREVLKKMNQMGLGRMGKKMGKMGKLLGRGLGKLPF
jgi:hypothetical protein